MVALHEPIRRACPLGPAPASLTPPSAPLLASLPPASLRSAASGRLDRVSAHPAALAPTALALSRSFGSLAITPHLASARGRLTPPNTASGGDS
jgi:hypothetical protein